MLEQLARGRIDRSESAAAHVFRGQAVGALCHSGKRAKFLAAGQLDGLAMVGINGWQRGPGPGG
jgi:hypothetical protein